MAGAIIYDDKPTEIPLYTEIKDSLGPFPFHGNIPNELWYEDYQGYNIGANGYLVVSFDNGLNFHELDTAKDVSWSINWDSVDITSRANKIDKALRPSFRTVEMSTELLFDSYADGRLYLALYASCMSSSYFLVGSFNSAGL